MHDLDDVAVGYQVVDMAATRNDLAIDLYRHPALGQTLGHEQLGDGAGGGQCEVLAIQSDFHPPIVARDRRPAQRRLRTAGPSGCLSHLSHVSLRETMPHHPAPYRRTAGALCGIFRFFQPFGSGVCLSIVGPNGPSAIFFRSR